jgi:alpha-galactosidase
VRVVGGFNDFDFGYRLAPGETLTTPLFYDGFTKDGFGEASRLLHALQIEEVLPDRAARKLSSSGAATTPFARACGAWSRRAS